MNVPSSSRTSISSPSPSSSPQDTLQAILAYLQTLLPALGFEVTSAEELSSSLPTLLGPVSRRLRATLEHLHATLRAGQRQPFFSFKGRSGTQEETTLRIFGACSLYLLRIAARLSHDDLRASEAFLDLCKDRPPALLRYDQLFCSPDSTQRRITRVLHDLPPDGRCLFLGDDDLASLALRLRHPGPIDVIEYDPRLLEMIHTKAPDIGCFPIDLFLGGLPRAFLGAFDAVVLDPPWDAYHAWCFLHKACLALRESPHARIFLSFCPLQIESLQAKASSFFRRLAAYGLWCEEIIPAHHLYPLQGTEFFDLLLRYLPSFSSPLLEVFPRLPFGFSHLYVLRRDQGRRPAFWRRWFQRLWHLA